MSEAVELDPGCYQGSYKLIGGAPALDFANLVSYRGTDRQHDWLDPAENAALWATAAGMPAAVASNVAELRSFREVVASAFLAVADNETPTSNDVHQIGVVAAAAWGRRRLEFTAEELAARWVDETPSLVGEIALNAAALLTSVDTLRNIVACRECRWLFLDATRNHSRQWCDPADCGNRARQRRHYRRRAQG